jgi:dTDP-4-amino-4,6-dideoxygalactose transaminase
MAYKIPLVDLKKQYRAHKKEIDTAIQSVINDAAFVSKKYPDIFEEQFGSYIGAKHCVATGSGSDALLTAYFAIGLKHGDEVITVANTFTATAEPLWFVGAKPVFVDVDRISQTMDPKKIEKAITKKTKAISVVHLFGHAANMPAIARIAKKHKLLVIEDCAHAHGTEIKGKKVGRWGTVGCYSFNPAKTLGAYGDAGAIVTDDKTIADRAREFINHGRTLNSKYHYDYLGLNMRMDGIQAAILSAKFKNLTAWVKKRRQIADWYKKYLPKSVEAMPKDVFGKDVFHLYVIKTPKRDALLAHLKEDGIEGGIHYPVPLHLQRAYAYLKMKEGSLPITESLSHDILSLPMYPELTEREVKAVAASIKRFFARN